MRDWHHDNRIRQGEYSIHDESAEEISGALAFPIER